MSRKIATVVGARPQFIKAAPVSRALAAHRDLSEVMVHTGQHFDREMSAVFFEELAIPPPAHDLGIHGGGHGAMTGRMLERLEATFLDERPAAVLVYGDTNSTLAGALAAAKLHIPVVHVEAGMRSFNRRMPEELNRVLTDHASDLLLCSTPGAVALLAREGIESGVHHVGDVMYDAALAAGERAGDAMALRKRLGIADRRYALATVHRAENVDDADQLRAVIDYLKDAAQDRGLVLPLHPRTRQAVERHGLDLTGLIVCEPLGYFDLHALLRGAEAVLTDSGGVQKEAYFHRVPCVTLRSETEWTETVEAGWNRLWRGPDYAPRRDITEYGDGAAAEKIVSLIGALLR